MDVQDDEKPSILSKVLQPLSYPAFTELTRSCANNMFGRMDKHEIPVSFLTATVPSKVILRESQKIGLRTKLQVSLCNTTLQMMRDECMKPTKTHQVFHKRAKGGSSVLHSYRLLSHSQALESWETSK